MSVSFVGISHKAELNARPSCKLGVKLAQFFLLIFNYTATYDGVESLQRVV